MADELIGKKLLAIRAMTRQDCEQFGLEPWGYEGNVVLMFEGGTQLIAAQDFEGNGVGAFFGRKGTQCFTLVVQQPTELQKRLEELKKKSEEVTKANKRRRKKAS